MDRVLVVSVGIVIKVVSVAIVVDHKVSGRIVTRCVGIVIWSIVLVQLLIGLPVRKVLVIRGPRLCGVLVNVDSVICSVVWVVEITPL